MIEQVSTSVKFLAFFTASKTGKTGLTVTIDIYDPSGTQIVTGGSATAIGGGLYAYTLSSDNSAEGEYAAIFKTTDSTVDAQHIPSLWVLGRAGVENLDAAVSTRSTLTAAQVNSEADTALSDVGLTSTITGRIDQAISTRLAAADYTAPSAAPSVSDIRAELDANSTKLANLDATISSRLADADYTAPTAAPSVVDIRTELDTNSTKLANLDAAVSSRLADADYTAPTSAPTVADIRAELATELGRIDASISSRLADADYVAPTTPPTAAEIATAVESSILNEGDGQAVLNAIVGAIGNSNVDEVALVAAIRADLERNGGKLDAIPTTSAPSASAVASATRTELATELARIDAAISSRLAPDGTLATVTTLTNAPTVPSASAIASQVRTELGTELGRIDQNISSRLASADYTAPTAAPTAAQNATAVRSELSVELARLDAPVSGATAPSAATVASQVRTELTAELAKVSALNTDRLAQVATTNIVGTLLAQAQS